MKTSVSPGRYNATNFRWNTPHVYGDAVGRQPNTSTRGVPPQVCTCAGLLLTHSSNGMDIILRDGVIEYRAIGGTLDFCERDNRSKN